ncbi:alpha/beta hydrolase fold domain-containing protein [uncultured Maribacter sp.]|uniref:alpha/beta hydrolase n=1 Tax=uncultured Maribacter sp. TaxID=431308 RepID=UPI0030D8E999
MNLKIFEFYKYLLLVGIFLIMNPIIGQSTDSKKGNVKMKTYNYADTLLLDFYSVQTDTFMMKPTIILVHGGGFTAGQRNGGDEKGISTYLAKLGFNVASIDYRLSRKKKSFGCDCAASIKMNTYTEAVADLSKAINYITKEAKPFQVDSSKIFLIGSSAGAETVLNFLFMRYDYRFKDLPYPDANILGAISISGAVVDENNIYAGNKVPLLFFHGVKDSVVPYGTNAHRNCATTDVGYLNLNGPKSIAERLSDIDGNYKVYYSEEGGHEWASLGFDFPELISRFIDQVLNGEATMRDFETIISTVESK